MIIYMPATSLFPVFMRRHEGSARKIGLFLNLSARSAAMRRAGASVLLHTPFARIVWGANLAAAMLKRPKHPAFFGSLATLPEAPAELDDARRIAQKGKRRLTK